MLKLMHDIKMLLSGPPMEIPRKVEYLTPDWEKRRVEMSLARLESRLQALEQLRQEFQSR